MNKPLWELRENHETRKQGEDRMIALSKQKSPESILILGKNALIKNKIIGYTCYSARCGQVYLTVGFDTVVQYPDSVPTNSVISVEAFFIRESSPSLNITFPVESFSKGYPLAEMSELQEAVDDAVELCMVKFFKKLDDLSQNIQTVINVMTESAWSMIQVNGITGGVKAKKLYRNGKGDIIKLTNSLD